MFYTHEGEIGFLFSDMVLSKKQYVYSLMEHLIRLILAIALLIGSTKHRLALWVFVCIEAGEVLDYILTYGDPWFDSKVFTWNTIKVGVFGLTILYERYGR
jgi:hypothetical protein